MSPPLADWNELITQNVLPSQILMQETLSCFLRKTTHNFLFCPSVLSLPRFLPPVISIFCFSLIPFVLQLTWKHENPPKNLLCNQVFSLSLTSTLLTSPSWALTVTPWNPACWIWGIQFSCFIWLQGSPAFNSSSLLSVSLRLGVRAVHASSSAFPWCYIKAADSLFVCRLVIDRRLIFRRGNRFIDGATCSPRRMEGCRKMKCHLGGLWLAPRWMDSDIIQAPLSSYCMPCIPKCTSAAVTLQPPEWECCENHNSLSFWGMKDTSMNICAWLCSNTSEKCNFRDVTVI